MPTEIVELLRKNEITGTPFECKNDILSNEILQKEVGYKKLADGTYLVSMVCPMPNVTAEMIRWWFWWHPKADIRYQVWFLGEHIRISYDRKDKAYFEQDSLPPFQPNSQYPVERIGEGVKAPLCIDFVSPQAFGFSEEKMKQISTEMSPSSVMRPRKLTKGPVLKEVLSLNDIPVMICDGDELQIEYNRFTENVTIVGLVSMSKGYPLSGEYGEDVFTLEISYDSGETEKHAFKNGVDVTTAFTVHKSSRINPVAESAKRTLTFGYDKNFEGYVINSVTLKTENRSKIKQLSFHSSDNGYDLLLYGVF